MDRLNLITSVVNLAFILFVTLSAIYWINSNLAELKRISLKVEHLKESIEITRALVKTLNSVYMDQLKDLREKLEGDGN